jgi:hypothetical protein
METLLKLLAQLYPNLHNNNIMRQPDFLRELTMKLFTAIDTFL